MPSVFRSIRLHSAGAKLFSADGSHSPLAWRYAWIRAISVFQVHSPALWQSTPAGLFTSRMFSSS